MIRIKLKRDGMLADVPMLVSGGNAPLAIAARESAMRALFQGQPYKPENYERWKEIDINFDPKEVFGGRPRPPTRGTTKPWLNADRFRTATH